MSEKTIKIGGATAFVTDSAMGIQQFLGMAEPPKYLLFDMMSEGVMPMIARAADAGNPGFSATFPHIYVLPFLRQFLDRGM